MHSAEHIVRFLYLVCKNRIIDLKRQLTKEDNEQWHDDYSAHEMAAGETFEFADKIEQIKELICNDPHILTGKQRRAVFKLIFIEHKSTAEVAEILQIDTQTVLNHKTKAINQLKEKVGNIINEDGEIITAVKKYRPRPVIRPARPVEELTAEETKLFPIIKEPKLDLQVAAVVREQLKVETPAPPVPIEPWVAPEKPVIQIRPPEKPAPPVVVAAAKAPPPPTIKKEPPMRVVKNEPEKSLVPKLFRKKKRAVYCFETMLVFACLQDACKVLNITLPEITKQLQGELESVRGFTFEYLDRMTAPILRHLGLETPEKLKVKMLIIGGEIEAEPEEQQLPPPQPKTGQRLPDEQDDPDHPARANAKKIICVTTGQIYKRGVVATSMLLKIAPEVLVDILKGRKADHEGLEFKYLSEYEKEQTGKKAAHR